MTDSIRTILLPDSYPRAHPSSCKPQDLFPDILTATSHPGQYDSSTAQRQKFSLMRDDFFDILSRWQSLSDRSRRWGVCSSTQNPSPVIPLSTRIVPAQHDDANHVWTSGWGLGNRNTSWRSGLLAAFGGLPTNAAMLPSVRTEYRTQPPPIQT